MRSKGFIREAHRFRACWGMGDLMSLIETRGTDGRQKKASRGTRGASCARKNSRWRISGIKLKQNSKDGGRSKKNCGTCCQKMGPLQDLPKDAKVDEGQLTRVEGHHQLDDQPGSGTITT